MGLYFSADYCKWCKDFTPKLTSVYEHFNDIGIVLVASDKTKEAFETYHATQPWPAIAYEDSIRVELRVVGLVIMTLIPCLGLL